MKYVVLTVLLAVMQTLPPVSRKATNSSTGASHSAQNKAASNQAPSAPSQPTINPNAPLHQENPRESIGNKDTQQPIRIGEFPPVPVTKDWFDRSYWLFSLLLVIVGGFQAAFLFGTLCVLQHQVSAMTEGNRIQRESLQAVQRAYVTFPFVSESKDVRVIRLANIEGKIEGWRFQLPIENTGNTPARDMRIHVNFHSIEGSQELPEDFTFPDYGGNGDRPVHVGTKGRIFSGHLDIADRIIDSLYAKKSRLFFYGWTTYMDVFEGTPSHRTEFCHELRILRVSGSEIVFEISGYGSHNTET